MSISQQRSNLRNWKQLFLHHALTGTILIFVCLIFYSSQYIVHQKHFYQSFSWNNQLVLKDEVFKTPPINVIHQDDLMLLDVIRKDYLNPPSHLPYNLTRDENDPSVWQAQVVLELLKKKKNGFFIECGALDGEHLSNTLMFEKVYGWEGVLIELNPDAYKQLLTKHRKAWTVPTCLSINSYPSEGMMKKFWHTEGVVAKYSFWKLTNDPIQKNVIDVSFKVQCFPLYSILVALNRTEIDYLSLDVEGNELNVLQTIPWDKVKITVITAEFNHVEQGKDALREYMESQGYRLHLDGAVLGTEQNIDFVFYHPLLLQNTLANVKK